MDRPFKPTGQIYRGEGAIVRAALEADDTHELVTRDEALRSEAELWMSGPSTKLIAAFGVVTEDLLTDGPIFHAQDPGWPDVRQGYNLKWSLPAGYTLEAPARYRIVITVYLTGGRRGTVVADLICEGPESNGW